MSFVDIGTRILGSLAAQRVYRWFRAIPILGSALQRVVQLTLPAGYRGWVRVPRGLAKGLHVLVDPRYELGYVRGDYEPWLGELLQRWLRPGDTFVDVGAHIGYVSLCAARLVGPDGVVVAFEPDPDNFARLQANTIRNNLIHVIHAVKAAIGSARGEGLFRRASPESSRVGGHLADRVEGDSEHARVPLLSLDDWDNELQPRVVKVDVEGGEIAVLRGASRIMNAARSRWVVELHGQEAREQVLGLLNSAQYQVRLLRPTHPVYHDHKQEYAIAEPLDSGAA